MATLSYVNVGVDVSKNYLDVHLHQVNQSMRVANSASGINKLTDILSQYKVGQIACEATGGYEQYMYKTLQKSHYKVWRVQPHRIRAFIISEGIKVKTDKIDAKMIALFASQKNCAYEQVQPSESNEKLRSLVSLRASITTTAAEFKTQLQQIIDPDCIKYLTKNLRFLEKQIDKVAKQIDGLIKSDKELQNKTQMLTSIPGIGDVSAATCLALLPELGKIGNKQAAALVGVAPIIKQSGNSKGYAVTGAGRAAVRSVLYMAGLTAIKHNPILLRFYQRLIEAGKPFKLAIVAVMRKLVVYMNTLVRKGELWNPAF